MSEPTASDAGEPAVLLPGGRSPRGADRVVSRGPGHSRAEIEPIQRARILDAFVEEVGRVGLAGAHIAKVCASAGVSTKEFYKVFKGKEECFLAAFDTGAQLVCDHGAAVFRRAEGRWEHRVRAAVAAMLGVLAANPAFSRLCIVEIDHAGPDAPAHLDAVVARCRQAFGGHDGPSELPDDLDGEAYQSSLVGSALAPLHDYVVDGKAAHLVELVPVLTYSLALPLVGRERAIRQLHPAAG